jgi:hypothetical protein
MDSLDVSFEKFVESVLNGWQELEYVQQVRQAREALMRPRDILQRDPDPMAPMILEPLEETCPGACVPGECDLCDRERWQRPGRHMARRKV